mgnify:CR=1 FL=1
MTNLGKMMKQAQEMQSKMADMQAQLEAVEISGAAGASLSLRKFIALSI